MEYKKLSNNELKEKLEAEKALPLGRGLQAEAEAAKATDQTSEKAPDQAAKEAAKAPDQSNYMPSLHNKGTDFIAYATGKKTEKKGILGSEVIENENFRIEFSKATKELSIKANKLLLMAIAKFSVSNDLSQSRSKNANVKINTLEVNIPIKEYAGLMGIQDMSNARKTALKGIDTLTDIKLKCIDFDKGKIQMIIQSGGVENNVIKIEFANKFADYLIRSPLTQIPKVLFKVDGRNPNAFKIGYAMFMHYFNDNNIFAGTNNRLSVKKLLEKTDLPSYDEVLEMNRSWRERIQDPFDRALEYLYSIGFFEEEAPGSNVIAYRYVMRGGSPLEDDELSFSYKDWTDSLIEFTLASAPDQSARIEAKKARRAAANEKRKRRKKASET